jgi:hypothetical protein
VKEAVADVKILEDQEVAEEGRSPISNGRRPQF